MGPIRAFMRPSHGAAPGEFATTASPFSPSHRSFSAQHRPCGTHAPSSSPLHNPHQRPHPYCQTCAVDPLRAGLMSSSVAPYIYHHFRTLLPPGAPPADPHPGVSLPQDTRGQALGETVWRKQAGRWKDSEYKWKKDEDKWKKESGENKCKKRGEDSAWSKDEYEWRKERDESKGKREKDGCKWKKSKDECEWRKDKDASPWRAAKNDREKWIKKDREQCKPKKDEYKWRKDKASPGLCHTSARADDPSSSRMALAFPFSDEEDDDEDEGRAAGESRHEAWPISDIVETEDEEGEPQEPLPQSLEAADAAHARLEGSSLTQEGPSTGTPAGESVASVVIKAPGSPRAQDRLESPKPERENYRPCNTQVPLEPQQCKELPPRHEEASGEEQDYVVGDEGRGDEEEEEDKEETDERKGAESGESPRDGIRATQRLRPRSYRQFLLTRERRSRVFLKARSYHLGRWFIAHFTHPYPSKDQKDQLATKTNMTRNQVSEWFGNMRRRIREATRGLGLCWEERVRVYNAVITGKSEPLPILPDDAINTWVPPVPQDPPVLESPEEVSVSPKFKTTLLHRYLNNSLEAAVCPSGDLQYSSTSASPQHDDPLQPYKSSSTSEPSDEFPQSLPLCTSSPKESFQALWNASFEHVKDGQVPSVGTRVLGRPDLLQVKPQGEEEGRVIKRYDRHRNYGSPCVKKQRTLEPGEDWLHRASTSTNSTPRPSTPGPSTPGPSTSRDSISLVFGGRKTAAGGESYSSRLHLASWTTRATLADARSSDEEGSADRCIRLPEELAAAYTLMQLQHM
nr:uncharacterized protein LOC123745182 [Procambarus clarkii]